MWLQVNRLPRSLVLVQLQVCMSEHLFRRDCGERVMCGLLVSNGMRTGILTIINEIAEATQGSSEGFISSTRSSVPLFIDVATTRSITNQRNCAFHLSFHEMRPCTSVCPLTPEPPISFSHAYESALSRQSQRSTRVELNVFGCMREVVSR